MCPKRSLNRIFLFLLFILALHTHAQWSYSEGLDGAPVSDVVILDSTLFTCGQGIFFRSFAGGPWEGRLTNISFTKILKAGQVLFAGYPSYTYMFRSFDHGNTWQLLDSTYCNPPLISITAMDTLLFFTSNWDIYRSNDYGNTYYSIKNNIFSLDYPQIDASESTLLCYGSYLSQPLYYSTDLGSHWDSLPTAGLPQGSIEAYSFVKFQGQYWLSTSSGIFLFDDMQANWLQTLNTGSFMHMRSMNGSLFASSLVGGLIRWHPLQGIWTPENIGLETSCVDSFYGEDSIYFLGTLFGPYTCSQPYTWQPFYDGLNQLHIENVAWFGDEVWAFTIRGLFCSTDNGFSFTKQTWDGYPEPRVFQMTDSLFYMVVQDTFYISSDQGGTWSKQVCGLPYSSQWPYLRLQDLAMNDDYLFLGTNKGLFRSGHWPVSWELLEALNTTFIRGVNIFIKDSLLLVVKRSYTNTYHYYIFRSEDNGESFDSLVPFSNGNYAPIINLEGEEFYAVAFNRFYHSTDGGYTWPELPSETTEMRASKLVVNSNDVFISGAFIDLTNSDIYLSMTGDNGETWLDIRGNLPVPAWPSMVLLKINQGRLFTAPGLNGLWYRDDLVTGLSGKQHEKDLSLAVFPNPATTEIILLGESEHCQAGHRISVYDIHGREVFTETVQEKGCTWHINVSSWPRGIYIVRLVFMNGYSESAKFVVY